MRRAVRRQIVIRPTRVIEPNMELPASYLKEPITQQAVETLYNFSETDADVQEEWRRLLEKRRDGDELWTFEASPGQIRIWGIALLRNGQVISTLVQAVD